MLMSILLGFFGLFGSSELTDAQNQCIERERVALAQQNADRMYEESEACIAARNRSGIWRECDDISPQAAYALHYRLAKEMADRSFGQCF